MSKKLKHGRILATDNDFGLAVAAIRCETDFLANSDLMLDALSALCVVIPRGHGPNGPRPIDLICAMILEELHDKSKEEVKLYERKWYSLDDSLTANFYLHHDNRKIAVVQLTSDTKSGKISRLCKDIAMHIVAFSPTHTTIDTVDWSQVDLDIPESLLSKPAEIIEWIREGKKKKYAKEHVLMDQPFVLEMDKSVSQIIDMFNRLMKTDVKIKEWHRTEV